MSTTPSSPTGGDDDAAHGASRRCSTKGGALLPLLAALVVFVVAATPSALRHAVEGGDASATRVRHNVSHEGGDDDRWGNWEDAAAAVASDEPRRAPATERLRNAGQHGSAPEVPSPAATYATARQKSTQNMMHQSPLQSLNVSSALAPRPYNFTTDVHIVSLTLAEDFFILFNNSALTSWLQHVQNVRSVTFVGPPGDYMRFRQCMREFYPDLNFVANNGADVADNNRNHGSNDMSIDTIPIRWENETHWMNYKQRYRCPYPNACQQLIKLHVFELRSRLGHAYLGDNVLLIDSDTVWARDATFVHPDGRVTYWQRTEPLGCDGMDPVNFTEAITAGPLERNSTTMTPYEACVRPEYPNSNGARHIVHHMLFQYDVMMHLHNVIKSRWSKSTVWEAFRTCHGQKHCASRIAEYELYFSFVSTNYPQRVRLETLKQGVDYMGSSGVCDAREMACCEERGVLLKGCHDHRVEMWRKNPRQVGDMCCR
ncbi:hypothetical protein ACHAWF_007945 [Thalassiosira exigua]